MSWRNRMRQLGLPPKRNTRAKNAEWAERMRRTPHVFARALTSEYGMFHRVVLGRSAGLRPKGPPMAKAKQVMVDAWFGGAFCRQPETFYDVRAEKPEAPERVCANCEAVMTGVGVQGRRPKCMHCKRALWPKKETGELAVQGKRNHAFGTQEVVVVCTASPSGRHEISNDEKERVEKMSSEETKLDVEESREV